MARKNKNGTKAKLSAITWLSQQSLEKNWKLIRDEGLAVMDKKRSLFLPEDENLREKGDWSQFTLWQQGKTFCISSLTSISLSQINTV